MPDDATLTIAVKVRDEATRQLAGITSRVRKTVFSPLTTMATQFRTLFRRVFSLEGVLAGGALFAGVRAVTDLAKNAREFNASFSPEEQGRIDRVVESMRRLGTQLQRTLGLTIADSGVGGLLDGMTLFLRDNAAGISAFFKDAGVFFDKAAAFVKVMASGKVTLGDLWDATGGGKRGAEARLGLSNALADMREAEALADAIEQIRAAGITRPGGFGTGVSIFTELASANEDSEALTIAFRALEQAGEDEVAQLNAIASALRDYRINVTDAGNVTDKFKDQFIAMQPATLEVQRAMEKLRKEWLENTEIIRDYLTVGEAATSVANGITDAFFDAINGTKSFGRAFADMTVSILNDISRLLVFRALFSAITGAIGGAVGGSPAGASAQPGAGVDPGAFGSGFTPPSGYAMGTSSARGGIATVGERGPERVILPRGARVEPSHRSGNGGGITINVVGARDPQATAAEVIAQLRTNPAFRRAFA